MARRQRRDGVRYSPTANGFFATYGVKGAGGWQNPFSRAGSAGRTASPANWASRPTRSHLRGCCTSRFPSSRCSERRTSNICDDALAAAAVRLSRQSVAIAHFEPAVAPTVKLPDALVSFM